MLDLAGTPFLPVRVIAWVKISRKSWTHDYNCEDVVSDGRPSARLETRWGEGALHLDRERRNKNHFQLKDAYVTLRDGPMVVVQEASSLAKF